MGQDVTRPTLGSQVEVTTDHGRFEVTEIDFDPTARQSFVLVVWTVNESRNSFIVSVDHTQTPSRVTCVHGRHEGKLVEVDYVSGVMITAHIARAYADRGIPEYTGLHYGCKP